MCRSPRCCISAYCTTATATAAAAAGHNSTAFSARRCVNARSDLQCVCYVYQTATSSPLAALRIIFFSDVVSFFIAIKLSLDTRIYIFVLRVALRSARGGVCVLRLCDRQKLECKCDDVRHRPIVKVKYFFYFLSFSCH